MATLEHGFRLVDQARIARRVAGALVPAQVVGRALSQAARLSTTEARSGAAPMRPRRMVGQASFLRWDGDWPFSPGVRARRAAAMEST